MSVLLPREWGVVVLAASAALAAPAPRAEGAPPATAAVDLSGRWRFNRELSDDEQAKLAAALQATAERQRSNAGASGEAERQGSAGGAGGRNGRGPGMGGRADRGRLSEGIDENDPRGAKRAAGPPELMTVTQAESEIVVEESAGQTRNLYPDGRSYRTDEGATRITTRWKDGKLVVERKNIRGWTLIETWDPAPDRKRVVIHLLLEGGSGPRLSLTRVYDRAATTDPGTSGGSLPATTGTKVL